MIFWKMAILGSDFDLKFDPTLAPGPPLFNGLWTTLHVWSASSIIVESIAKSIWQYNLLMGSYSTFKMPPGRLDFWC